jgi:hypothetical protein
MNMKMKLKKSFYNIYSKLIHLNEVNSEESKNIDYNISKQVLITSMLSNENNFPILHQANNVTSDCSSFGEKSFASSNNIKDSSSKETSFHNDFLIRSNGISASSSGYGTSSESPVLSFIMNLDKNFYDEFIEVILSILYF